jgi:hypothetical protein
MKKLFLSLSLLASLAFFSACTTDVDLYADYKDIPVIYGLLNATNDTNYVRINRAFSGSNDTHINANEVALIADSCNYPGKLKAYIVEYKSGYGNQYLPTGDTVELDTMTIRNKEEGLFYSPNQKVYFTDGMTINNESLFGNNNWHSKYKYKLFVFKYNDTISAETNIVGGEDFKIATYSLHFTSEPTDRSSKIKFSAADNAVFYDLKFVFTYHESINGGPMVDKQVSYSCGSKSVEELNTENGMFFFSYNNNILFNLLKDAIGADTIYDANHPNVERSFDQKPIQIQLSAGANELYNYIQVNSQSGFLQTVPDYTNVSGGYGVFSSRINLTKEVGLSSMAQTDLYGKESWGFVQH